MLARQFAGLEPYAPTLLRIVVGITFFLHGLPKLQNLSGATNSFGRMGIPFPEVMAPFIAGLEVFGGLLLVIGLGTRLVSALFMAEMIVAILIVKSNIGYIAPPGQGAGAELDALLLAGAWVLLVLGAGELSVDRNLLQWDTAHGLASPRSRQ